MAINTRDPEEALALSGALFYPHTYKAIGEDGAFSFGLKATKFDGLTVGIVSFGGEVCLTTEDLGAYHVRSPLAGRMLSSSRQTAVFLTSTVAAMYRPDDNMALECVDPETVSWGVKFDTEALERQLSGFTHLGRFGVAYRKAYG